MFWLLSTGADGTASTEVLILRTAAFRATWRIPVLGLRRPILIRTRLPLWSMNHRTVEGYPVCFLYFSYSIFEMLANASAIYTFNTNIKSIKNILLSTTKKDVLLLIKRDKLKVCSQIIFTL